MENKDVAIVEAEKPSNRSVAEIVAVQIENHKRKEEQAQTFQMAFDKLGVPSSGVRKRHEPTLKETRDDLRASVHKFKREETRKRKIKESERLSAKHVQQMKKKHAKRNKKKAKR